MAVKAAEFVIVDLEENGKSEIVFNIQIDVRIRGFQMKKRICARAVTVMSFLFSIFCFTACGSQELSFGEERFYGVKTAEELSFANEREYPVQIAVGETRVWTLTAGSKGSVYERELETETPRSMGSRLEDEEFVMGISAVGDQPYACVSCGETVQVRKLSGDGQWETVLSIPWEEAPEQLQPTVFLVDRQENAYVAAGNEIWRYSTGEGHRTVYQLKESVTILQEKKSGVVEAVAKSSGEIALYALGEDGKAKKKWTLKLSTGNLAPIQTDDADTLTLAVDNRILFLDNNTGKITAYFDCISAGVSTDLLGGLCLVSKGVLYLEEKTADQGGRWLKLAQQGDVQGDRTLLVYGTVDLSEAMKERIVSFNRTNPDYYIAVEEYGSEDPWAGKVRLQAAVTSGHGPDILDLYGAENYISYAEKGYLEDLEPYLSKEDFSDDILWQVQDLYRVDGKLCMLVPHFSMQGLAIHPEYTGNVDNWNLDSFLQLVERNRGEKYIVAGSTARAILYMLFEGLQEELVDMEGEEAHFDTPEFVRLLEFCKENGKTGFMADGVSYGHEEVVDMVLLSSLYLNSPMSCMELYAYYGKNALPYGYPVGGGQVFLVENNLDACGISASSANKEGAWEFLLTLFEENYQVEMSGGINVSWGIRESCWYRMWEPYMAVDTLGFSGRTVDPPRAEDVEMFAKALLQGNLTANLTPYDITELVLEEAEAYFAGDRSVTETARIIQNRAQLMLEE